jgi:hypothetical protein
MVLALGWQFQFLFSHENRDFVNIIPVGLNFCGEFLQNPSMERVGKMVMKSESERYF